MFMPIANEIFKPLARHWKRVFSLMACGLMLGVFMLESSQAPAHAFLFFKRKQPQQSIPPATQTKPGLMQPPPVPPVVKTPSVPVQPVDVLVKSGVFPPDAAGRREPINRAEWATILVKAIAHNTTMVSEFPFYRDVPLNHPAYVPIEVAREKKLLTYQGDHGYYYPARPVTNEEAYVSIAHAITGPLPTPEQVANALQGFTDRDQLPAADAPAVAKMVRVHFFKTPTPQTTLRPHEDLTFTTATPLVTDLIHLVQMRSPLQADKETAVAVVPAGLSLTLSPATSILEADLNVGQNVNFTLVNPTASLPKESRFEGQVIMAKPSARNYIVQFTTVKTPEGDEYKTNAEIRIAFSPRSRISFLVPGELYSAVTTLPPDTVPPSQPPASSAAPAETEPKPVIPFAQPKSPTTPAKPQTAPVKKPSAPAKGK